MGSIVPTLLGVKILRGICIGIYLENINFGYKTSESGVSSSLTQKKGDDRKTISPREFVCIYFTVFDVNTN